MSKLIGANSCGFYDELPDRANAVPINLPGSSLPVAIMSAGASARLPIDASYRGSFELVGAAIGAALANAQAYEDEHRHAEALVAIDRARTTFFSNASHEFRTSLTLMLGPLEEAPADCTGLPTSQRERLQLAHRNALRVLKPVGLANFTAELASNFRSACDSAALKLVVERSPLDVAVHVDRDMWEKIVLDLISNAFKFTFHGQITVSLISDRIAAGLVVRDTGIGIPAHELPRVFERFHRIGGQRGARSDNPALHGFRHLSREFRPERWGRAGHA